MLRLVEVDSYYGRSHILHGVNLDVQPGEITTMLGRNGTGKTTLLKTIMGLTDRTTGEIRFGDENISGAAHLPPRPGRLCLCSARPRNNSGFHHPREHSARRIRPARPRAAQSRNSCRNCFPTSSRIWIAAAACCRADSSSSWRSQERWRPSQRSCCSTSRPKASSPPSLKKSKR